MNAGSEVWGARYPGKRTTPSAYFFDLGGTLVRIEDDEIAVDAEGHVMPLPNVVERLRSLADAPIFVVTNQAGVALGYVSEAQACDYVDQFNGLTGGIITSYRICTHHPAAGCPCRKPRPGMLHDLAAVHDVDLGRAVMVGDSASDEACATAAGIGRFRWATEFFGWDQE